MYPATRPTNSLIDRVLGVVQLNQPTFEDIKLDKNATNQALIVVVAAAVAAAIGSLGQHQDSLIFQTIMAVVNWIIFSVVAYFVGASLFHGSPDATIGRVMRLIGFAQAPKLLAVLGFVPIFGWLVGILATIWFVVVAIYALRSAFNFQTDRAVLTAIVSLIAMLVVQIVFAIVFGISGAFLSAIF